MQRTRIRYQGIPVRRPITPVNASAKPQDLSGLLETLHTMYGELISRNEKLQKMFEVFESVKQGLPGAPGRPGKDGRDVTQSDIEKTVQKYIVQPKDGKDSIAPTIDEIIESLLQSNAFSRALKKHIKSTQSASVPEIDTIITLVTEELAKKRISVEDIEGLDMRFTEMRGHINASKEWRGGGDTVVAGSGVTITNTVNGNKQISATGGGTNIATSIAIAVTSGNNVTIDLTQFIHMVSAVQLVFRSGGNVPPGSAPIDGSSAYSISGTILTVYNASSTDGFLLTYTY